MPPKAKFTRENIIVTALELVREAGANGLTARALGKKLGSSSCPIFGLFKNMDEVRTEVLTAAKKVYNGYVDVGLKSPMPFKGVGEQYIKFAQCEPELFKLLFMEEQIDNGNIVDILQTVDDNYEAILQSITNQYNLDASKAKALYTHLWIYTHGIATLINTNTCKFTEEEISSMMTDVFLGVFARIKGGNKND